MFGGRGGCDRCQSWVVVIESLWVYFFFRRDMRVFYIGIHAQPTDIKNTTIGGSLGSYE